MDPKHFMIFIFQGIFVVFIQVSIEIRVQKMKTRNHCLNLKFIKFFFQTKVDIALTAEWKSEP